MDHDGVALCMRRRFHVLGIRYPMETYLLFPDLSYGCLTNFLRPLLLSGMVFPKINGPSFRLPFMVERGKSFMSDPWSTRAFICFRPPMLHALMVVEGEVLNDLPRFISILVAEFAAGGMDIVAEFYGPSWRKELSKEMSSKILPCGDGSCWKTFKPIAGLITKEN
ncbi:hypothetical protein Tco_0786408 [Tanacetum coccineum]